jgi:hypothetical protein
MNRFFRSVVGAGLLAPTVLLVLAAQSAPAQTPPPRPAPPVAPRLTNPPATAPNPARPAGFAVNNPQSRVYTVPSQGSSSLRRRLHYGYFPARRDIDVYKPWLKPD